jgi:hypothetical protein
VALGARKSMETPSHHFEPVFTTSGSAGTSRSLCIIPLHCHRSLIGVFVGVLFLLYCSASAPTSSRQKAGISGTTRPQTKWGVVETL